MRGIKIYKAKTSNRKKITKETEVNEFMKDITLKKSQGKTLSELFGYKGLK